MKQLALAFALLALPAVVGCGMSEARTADAPKKKDGKSKKKSKLQYDVEHRGKGYKKPQDVWGPIMLEEHMSNLKSSDPNKRKLACVGLFNMRSGARDALPDLKRLLKTEKNRDVSEAAKRAIKAIEDG